MNPRIASLHPYPFQRLANLTADITPPENLSAIRLSIGEPKHAAPKAVMECLIKHLAGLSSYPTTKGHPRLRLSISEWLSRRFELEAGSVDPERQVLPVCGTREALFSIAQTLIDTSKTEKPVVIMPNPFYQIYEGAALLAGAEPYYLNTTAETDYKMDFASVPKAILARTQLVYLCSPGNPTGAVASLDELRSLIKLAQQHDFVIASDECYSEIYFDESAPPPGLLQAAQAAGLEDFDQCLVFHSLSKRSSLPGLRSGFVAGDGQLLEKYFHYRTYHGCTMSPAVQQASITAWNDEAHVQQNREQYRAKFSAVLEILNPVIPVHQPEAGFYLWPVIPGGGESFSRDLYAREHVMVLPGSYLSRETSSGNPGSSHVRLALVATIDECVEAARRMRRFIETL